MFKKRFFITVFSVIALMMFTLVGCDMGGDTVKPSGSDSESVLESESLTDSKGDSHFDSTSDSSSVKEESDSSSKESASESESDSKGEVVLEAPELSISLTSTARSIILNVEENDPNEIGEITGIVLAQGKNKTVIDDLEQRTFDGLLSLTNYTVHVTYTYNIGEDDFVIEKKASKMTSALRTPTLGVTYEATSTTSFSFDLNEKDPSEILEILSIKIISKDGDEIPLDDLTARAFEGIPCGEYELVVEYQYDLNKGDGPTVEECRATVATQIDPLTIPDFVVEVEEGKNPVILQITDTQIIDSSQNQTDISVSYYAPENFGVRLENYLRETVNAVQPDLIIMTGDNVYGKFDDSGASLTKLIAVMESFEIPWAPVFGNHDNESKKGVAWQCEQYENAEHCLFKRNTLTGNGNYTVGIAQGGKLTRVFFMMDSNGCGSPSRQSTEDGQMKTYAGFGDDQVAWFESLGSLINTHSPETKISFAFHIQIQAFTAALKKYGYPNQTVINIDQHPDREEGDIGYLGGSYSGAWDTNGAIFKKMVAIGCDSIYVGHEHQISTSIVHEGVRFQFGQKIATYDGVNWLQSDGSIVFAFSPYQTGDPIMGGTVNVLDETGAITNAYIYFCGGISHNGRA